MVVFKSSKAFNDPLSRRVYEGVNIRNNSAISLIIIINRLNFLNDRATKAKFVGDNNKNLQKSNQQFH